MNESPTLAIAPAAQASNAATDSRLEKALFSLPAKEWGLMIGFMVCMSLVGLSFYPAFLPVIVILINRFIKNRYDFMLMLIIMATGTAFLPEHVLPLKLADPMLVLAFAAMIVYRRTPLITKILLTTLAYVAFLFVMSRFSDEVMSIQILTMRQYASIICFILPLWLFANREFDMAYFFRKAIGYFLIIMTFYALDGFVFSGFVMVPATFNWAGYASTFNEIIAVPFSTFFPRKYPSGMYIIAIMAYPLARYYKLKWWQWAIIVVGLAATRTMTVIGAFIVTFLIFQGKFLKVAAYCLAGAALLCALYVIDSTQGGYMRVASTVEQFAELVVAQDEEDLAQFGSSRMAQIIPKYEALESQGCLLTGFGFIHHTKTTNPRYQIHNELYSDIEQSDESAAMVEVSQFNTILHTGFIGLLVQALLYLGMYFMIRRLPDAAFYMSVLLMVSVMGVGGFTGLNHPNGVLWVGLALGTILLQAKRLAEGVPRPLSRTAPL